jgi:predicted DNA-binding protein
MDTLISFSIPSSTYEKLAILAQKTGQSINSLYREAIITFIEDLEDTEIAIERLKEPTERLTMLEAEKKLGLAN